MTADLSSAQLIRLDHTTMKASLIQKWDRPDGQLSHLRGNMQILPDTNIFVGWSANDGYVSEHSADGDVLMEARFLSDRLSTYRAYKFFGFRGRPQHPPTVKAIVHSTSASECVTLVYVSWNGATDVAYWNFYTSKHNEPEGFVYSGRKNKTGFETVYSYGGASRCIVAEAVAIDGTPIRNSSIEAPIWQDAGCSLETAYFLESEQRMADGAPQAASHDIYDGLKSMASTNPLVLVALGFCLSYLPPLLRRPQGRIGGGKQACG